MLTTHCSLSVICIKIVHDLAASFIFVAFSFLHRYIWKIPVTYTSSNFPSFNSNFEDIIWMDHKELGRILFY